jgi:site-specific recombinase XerD
LHDPELPWPLIQKNRVLEATFCRAGLDDVSSVNFRKTFATRRLSRGAAITDVLHLLGHASVKTPEKAYAAFLKNERFKQTIDLLDDPVQPRLKIVR